MYIRWAKMHTRKFDGTCIECGSNPCKNAESVAEWTKALKELEIAQNLSETARNSDYYSAKVSFFARKLAEKTSD